MTVAIKKDGEEEYRHITYAVAVVDQIEAVQLAIEDSDANAAMVNCPIEEELLQQLDVRPGELIVVHDDEIDPITSQPRRH
ncbi:MULTISPECIES: hypothetical protein [unclassified Bradyrhizobium]|uniref:hypothetical protein n=1 Tax=Bradyrhizobium sp. USDA 4541 TaxID=2817704 RepID=UPI0020A257DE|nr:hypothetical protein [Bradyrhizobium sp. USDA 4541]MCP1846775.1 hypothetical protein [Bradyrhizobium sp. USDA 4541]